MRSFLSATSAGTRPRVEAASRSSGSCLRSLGLQPPWAWRLTCLRQAWPRGMRSRWVRTRVGGAGLDGGLGGVIACSLFGPCHVGIDAPVGDADRVAALAGSGAGEGAVELLDVDATLPEFALDGGVHGREQLGAKFVQDLVDIN